MTDPEIDPGMDWDRTFQQAWGEEPLLPDPLDRLAAGKRRLRRRRTVTTTLGSVAAVTVVVAAASLVGGGASRSAEPDFATRSTSASAPAPTSLDDEFPVRASPEAGSAPVWSDDRRAYRSAPSVTVLRVDESRPVLDARTGAKIGHELVVETRWRGVRQTQYFDYAEGRYRGGGGDPSYDEVLARAAGPLFYDSGPGYFELFDIPVGVDSAGLTPKVGASIVSQRTARTGEFSTRRFDASAPSVGVATIAGFRYYAIAGYTSTGKDVIVAQQARDRTLAEFLAEVKGGMDDGSITG
jgi:hypothetical protein